MGWVAPRPAPEAPESSLPAQARTTAPSPATTSPTATSTAAARSARKSASPSATAKPTPSSSPSTAPTARTAPSLRPGSPPQAMPWRGMGETGLALGAGQRMPTELKAATQMGWVAPSRPYVDDAPAPLVGTAPTAQPGTPSSSNTVATSARAEAPATPNRSLRGPLQPPRWPKPGEITQLRGEAGSLVRVPAAPEPVAFDAGPGARPAQPGRRSTPGDAGSTRGPVAGPSRSPAAPPSTTSVRGTPTTPPSVGRPPGLRAGGVLRAPEGQPRPLAGPSGQTLAIPAPPAGAGDAPGSPATRTLGAAASRTTVPGTSAGARPSVANAAPARTAATATAPVQARTTPGGWRSGPTRRATPLSITAPHGDTQQPGMSWGRPVAAGAGRPTPLSSSTPATALRIPAAPEDPNTPLAGSDASSSATRRAEAPVATGGAAPSLAGTARSPRGPGLRAPSTLLGAPGETVQLRSDAAASYAAPSRAAQDAAISQAVAASTAQPTVARAASRAGTRGIDFRRRPGERRTTASPSAGAPSATGSSAVQAVARAAQGRTGAIQTVRSDAAPSLLQVPRDPAVSEVSSGRGRAPAAAGTSFGTRGGSTRNVRSAPRPGVAQTFLQAPRSESSPPARSRPSSNARPRPRPRSFTADASGRPVDWAWEEVESDDPYVWSADPGLSSPKRATRDLTDPKPTARQEPESAEEVTERQVFQALKRLSNTSPEARSILKDVKRALDDLRRLDRLRKL